MRSAERLRLLAALGCAALLAACASGGDPGGNAREGNSSSSSAGERSAPAGPPVSPEVQRAFDDASSALRSGRSEEAERAFRALAQAHPDLGGPHANIGVIQRRAGKLTESVGELELAVRINPRQAVYWNQLGVSYRLAGQFGKARDAYEKAIALNPRYAAPMLNLGILYDLYLGDGARALDLYSRYLALLPNGDPTVTKWVADLKNRKSAAPSPLVAARKEKE